jgi:hypothetical protein
MSRIETMPVGIVVERYRLNSTWLDHAWRAVAVLPGRPQAAPGSVLATGEGWAHYLAGTLEIELCPQFTASYRDNLASSSPRVYVVLRPSGSARTVPVEPHLATVAPDEAQSHLESGEETVDGVPIPPVIAEWVGDYIARYHVEQPFYKRERKPYDPRKQPGGDAPKARGRS